MSAGKVYLVGAGPGAPDLLTLRAARLLERADIVFHDALVHPDTLALAGRAERVAVGKRCGRHSTAQRFINKRLVDAARKHAVVVRLKGGDPMLFGRAQEEIDALRNAGVDCQVVPGVTAALAAAAEIGVSLTQRGVARSVTFATPRVAPGEAAAIAAALRAQGKPGHLPVVAVENASLPGARRRYLTLAELPRLAEESFTGPVLLLVGEVFATALVRERFLAASRTYLLRAGGLT
jgi:uroporphyrin-III C-methyltransferase